MPKKGEYVKFKNQEKRVNSLFIIYADLKEFQYEKMMESKIKIVLHQQILKTYCLQLWL